jgi:hypothetical protein
MSNALPVSTPAARLRLTAPAQMGRLFRVLALAGRDWPDPGGFQ